MPIHQDLAPGVERGLYLISVKGSAAALRRGFEVVMRNIQIRKYN